MTTLNGPVLDPETATPVKDMPPLAVTTTGIPDVEHLPGTAGVETPPKETRRSHRNRWIALAMAGVLGASLGAVAYIVTRPVVTNDHMGLSSEAWTDYRAGERAVATTGVGTPDWQSYRSGERAVATAPTPNLAKAAALPVWTDAQFYPTEPASTGPNLAKLAVLPMP